MSSDLRKLNKAGNRWIRASKNTATLSTHPESICEKAEYCCVHKPSKHSMSKFPFNWRSDIGLMERICPHGVGHPDPDALNHLMLNPSNSWMSVHGCDGCCRG